MGGLLFAMVFIITGIGFKLSVAFSYVCLMCLRILIPLLCFLSVAPKVYTFGLLMRLLVETMPGASVQWHEIIIVISILSMAVGNIAAIIQTNIKRMLAYSSIAAVIFC